jgi:hypothetical protein
MSIPIISIATEADLPEVLAINEACTPHVSSISLEELRALAAQACHFKVVRIGGQVAGFFLALGPGQVYESLNYRWFCERYEDFIYVDRIAISREFRGTGIGRMFYEDLERTTASGVAWITCEVNLRPPNPESLAFHQRLGFQEVGQQDTEGGGKRVSLLVRASVVQHGPVVQ